MEHCLGSEWQRAEPVKQIDLPGSGGQNPPLRWIVSTPAHDRLS